MECADMSSQPEDINPQAESILKEVQDDQKEHVQETYSINTNALQETDNIDDVNAEVKEIDNIDYVNAEAKEPDNVDAEVKEETGERNVKEQEEEEEEARGDKAEGNGDSTEHLAKDTETKGGKRQLFDCKVCGVQCMSKKKLEAHYGGNKHKRNQAHFNRHGKLSSSVKTPRIKGVIDKCEDPLIGLEFVMEIQKEGQEEYYMCYLCDAVCDRSKILEHLTGVRHRVKFIKEQKLTEYTEKLKTFTKRSEENSAAKEFAKEIEAKHGRKDIKVKNELDPFFRNQIGAKRRADDPGGFDKGKRYRQSGAQLGYGPEPDFSLTDLMEMTLNKLDHFDLQNPYDTQLALRLSRNLTEAVLDANFGNPNPSQMRSPVGGGPIPPMRPPVGMGPGPYGRPFLGPSPRGGGVPLASMRGRGHPSPRGGMQRGRFTNY